ncbi:MAG: LPS export ABC transporter periplasmic protein LptC [Limnohabitans sp.]|nr:LPS export ABC transporter periplasmic protein LptC [Limnohabitans sp.]
MNKLLRPPLMEQPGLMLRLHLWSEMFMAYLPMLVLMVLFLFSVWLVRSVPRAEQVQPSAPPTHVPDYDFKNFNLKSYEMNGKLKSSIHGVYAEHFQDTLNTEIKEPFVLIYSNERVMSVKGKKAIVNEDGSQVQLIGQILLKREGVNFEKDDMQISGEFLHFFGNTDLLISHLPVNIVRGKNLFKADKLEADNLNQVYTLKGRVHATLVPETDKP